MFPNRVTATRAGTWTRTAMLFVLALVASSHARVQAAARAGAGITPGDLTGLRSVADPRLSPDGTRALFAVQYSDEPGRPYSRIWSVDLATREARPWGGAEGVRGGSARWSPDGRQVAYLAGGALHVATAGGSNARQLAAVDDTNHPLPRANKGFAWSPDGSRIAYLSAVPGDAPPIEADPIVISRYLYRPEHGWPNRFNDGKRLHLFVVDVASGTTRQLTHGDQYVHSIDWSPDGGRILFLRNAEVDQDFVYNYDIFSIDVASGKVTRHTATRGVEYAPTYSPDGSRIAFSGLMRPVTSSETNMEDPHVWVMDLASGALHHVGAAIDNVQGRPVWSHDGRHLYFTVQSRGSTGLVRMPVDGGAPVALGPGIAAVSTFDVARDRRVLAAVATPRDLPQLYLLREGGADQVTDLNADALAGKAIAEVRPFTFRSYDEREIEAFLTVPPGAGPASPARSHPMIVMIHGGPHGQQGPNFVHKAQAYAAWGYAVLMVNYRGSTGYGQAFANAIARDQNGGEAMDVLRGVDAALAANPWIDPDRLGIEGGSYGGQLTNWIVTQTTRFKAGVPWASISNLVSHNYMSSYHDYLEQEYFGKPHTGGIMDMLWIRSPIRFVHQVRTPMLLSHGDNDLLVNVAEIEQFYTALYDAGVEVKMLRYPREGHGMREVGHVIDFLERSIAWYEDHFKAAGAKR